MIFNIVFIPDKVTLIPDGKVSGSGMSVGTNDKSIDANSSSVGIMFEQ